MKNLFESIKVNLTIITLLPLVLGGAWQIYSLVAISMHYLRFFSATQQIADGILFLSVWGTFFMIVYFFKTQIYDKPNNMDKVVTSSNNRLVIKIVIAAVATVVLFVLLIYKMKLEKLTLYTIWIDTMLFSIASILMLFTYSFARIFLKRKYSNLEKIKDSYWFYFFRGGVLSAVLSIVFLFLCYLFDVFNNNYSLPSNLKNITYVLDKYSIETKSNRDSVKIRYMNDKYIFIQDSSKVEIVKLDYMFKDAIK